MGCAEEAVPQGHGKATSGAATCTSGWQRGKDAVPPAFENAALGRTVDSVTCSHSCGKSPSPVVMFHPQRPSHPYVC